MLEAKQLLLVEDNPVFVEQLEKAIKHLPDQWELTSCVDGRKALSMLKDKGATTAKLKNFDLALVDLGLPDISGIEVIRHYRQKLPGLPIVVVSVIAAESTVLAAIQAGANGYILKDESIDQIAHGINQVLQGIYPLSPSLARFLFKQLTTRAAQGEPSADFNLTPREHETLRYLAKGHTYDIVASMMGVATSTIQSNVRNIYRKLNVHSQVQAVSKARDLNLI